MLELRNVSHSLHARKESFEHGVHKVLGGVSLKLMEDVREFSELGQSFDEPVKTYSSGMNARLGFTTILLTKVDILLIDELLSAGDAEFRRRAEEALLGQLSEALMMRAVFAMRGRRG